MTHKSVLLLVVFVGRDNPDIEIIHIVSARKAESLEEAYEEQIS